MATTYTEAAVTFHGVNEHGYAHANPSITDGRDIAWLQDTPTENAWGRWNVVYRDVVVLDGEGTVAGVLNVTDNSLEEAVHQETLRGYIDTAMSAL